MTYLVAALLAIPITMFGIIGLFEFRQIAVRIKAFTRESRAEEPVEIAAATPAFEPDHELRFTQSLLALSKVRSPEHGGSLEREPAESSSLALVHPVQSRIPDRAA